MKTTGAYPRVRGGGSRSRSTIPARSFSISRAAWTLAGEHAPGASATAEAPLVIDLDPTLVTAHSEKEQAAATFKRGYGFHPLIAFADHGPAGTGEMLAIRLRPGNAGSNTTVDHVAVTKAALPQLPGPKTSPARAS